MASRQEKDYGLAPLTFALAAQLLGVTEQELKVWVMDRLRPGAVRWSHWTSGKRPLPEAILRLYQSDKMKKVEPVPPERRKGRAG